LDNSADVNSRDIEENTPLKIAVTSGSIRSMQQLLSAKNIEVDAKDIHGRTALLEAAERG
jgi:ankyrin repeat protein